MSSKKNKLRITLEGKVKLPLTLLLLVYSIIVSFIVKRPIFAAMLWSNGGDYFMLKSGNCFYDKEDNDFYKGVFLFMISHMFYAGFMNTPISNIIIVIMLNIAAIYVCAIAFGVKNKIILVSFYVIILVLSVINAFNFNRMAFVGAIIFFISDALIGIFDIIKNKSLLRHILVWGTYVPAQILLLSSFI